MVFISRNSVVAAGNCDHHASTRSSGCQRILSGNSVRSHALPKSNKTGLMEWRYKNNAVVSGGDWTKSIVAARRILRMMVVYIIDIMMHGVGIEVEARVLDIGGRLKGREANAMRLWTEASMVEMGLEI